ncbi:MAG TPA: hypothetical protein VK956_05745 [Verrucomicrobium sp.]|nr:hypothetical protein [Verrucomicrobium sp.]
MLALFLPLIFIWVVATLTSYLSLLMALFARFIPGADEAKVPHLLRFAYLWGFGALGCLAISALLITVDFLCVKRSFHMVTFDQWMDFSRSFFGLGPFAAIDILPAGICWIWWSRSYGAGEK